MNRTAIFTVCFCVLAALPAPRALAQGEEKIPPTMCILDIDLPPGAKILDGGRPIDKTRFTYKDLNAGMIYGDDVHVRFADGTETTKKYYFRGGWHVRLPMAAPSDQTRPEVEMQSGHAGGPSNAVFSSDNRHLLTWSHDNQVILWDPTARKVLRVFSTQDRIILAQFLPGDKSILAVSHGAIITWDRDSGRVLRTLPQKSVYEASLSKDGKTVLLGHSKEAYLIDVQTGDERQKFNLPQYTAQNAQSPDGRRVAISYGSGPGASVRLFDADGTLQNTLADFSDSVRYLVFAADGRTLATASGHELTLWNMNTYEQAWRKKFAKFVSHVALHPNGRHLLVNVAGDIMVLNEKGELVHEYVAGKEEYGNATAMRSDETLVTNGRAIWKRAARDAHAILKNVAASWSDTVRFGPDENHLLVLANKGILQFNLAGGVLKQRFAVAEEYFRLENVSPNGRFLLTFAEKEIKTNKKSEDAPKPAKPKVILRVDEKLTAADPFDLKRGNHHRKVHVVKFQAGKTYTIEMTSATLDSFLRLEDSSGTHLTEDDDSGGEVHARIVFNSPKNDSYRIIATTFDDDSKGDYTLIVTEGLHNADDYRSRSMDSTWTVWDTVTGKKLQEFQATGESFSDGKIGNDPRLITAESRKNVLHVFQKQTDAPVKIVGDSKYGISYRGSALSPDGRFVATHSIGGRPVILWDASSGQRIRECALPTMYFNFRTGVSKKRFNEDLDFEENAYVNHIGFSPDGKRIFGTVNGWEYADRGNQFNPDLPTTTNMLEILVAWDVATGREIYTLPLKGKERVNGVRLSRDGRLALVLRSDKTATVWDVDRNALLRTFKTYSDWSDAAADLSPDGRWVAIRAAGNGLQIWDVASGAEAVRLMGHQDPNEWLAVTPEGLFDGTPAMRQLVSFRVGGGLNIVPVDRFFQDFYRPGLLANLWGGKLDLPEVQIAQKRPPSVKLLSPTQDAAVDVARITLEIEVEDQGGGIRGPWLFHNNTRVLAGGKGELKNKTLKQQFNVALVEGENRLEIRAASEDGSWESEPARVVLRYAKPLEKPEIFVLAVGVNKYAQESMNLRYAKADAQAIGQLFEKRGQALYKKVHIHPLLDEQATRKGIRQALDTIAKQAKPQDTLVVYMAGHGAMVGQRYYFIPHEFKRQDGTTLEEDIRKQGLPVDEFGDALAAVPALKRLVAFDTCQSGGAVGLGKMARNPFAFRGAIERLSRSQGVFTIAATAASEEAQEIKELGHGVLTYTLLAGMKAVDKGPLDADSIRPRSPDQVVDVLEWFSFASGQVPRLTRRYFGREQDVQTSGQGSSFPVLPVEEK